ncbi:DUF2269 domain-containing protein [Salicibibacter cibarius]|uniref:DUF2269 domain-containing protein n=1 Tax=Salicibibacter cibarius TaxID=2743000 RepID=A0A7T7CAI4_9BACI|nr:DUF2269 domain-containing protein [Salicibibacter cibarius]QQK74749.1 DUF2269 domain-containing protein [Salicibibacter cibarius]
MALYDWLVFIHIFSAIAGMGPGFAMTFMTRGARTMAELNHAFRLRHRLHRFVMIGGILLLITGIWMGALQPALFQQGWYITSLVLFLVALAFGPLVLAPRSKPVKAMLNEHKGDDIPESYYAHSRTLFFFEHVLNSLFLIIIVLMILKPF